MTTVLRTILVDDEPRGLSSLQKLLEYACPEVQVVASCHNADDAKAGIITIGYSDAWKRWVPTTERIKRLPV